MKVLHIGLRGGARLGTPWFLKRALFRINAHMCARWVLFVIMKDKTAIIDTAKIGVKSISLQSLLLFSCWLISQLCCAGALTLSFHYLELACVKPYSRAGLSNGQTGQLPRAPRLDVMTLFFGLHLILGKKLDI